MDKKDFMLRWLSQLLLGTENELWTDDMASAASEHLRWRTRGQDPAAGGVGAVGTPGLL